MTVIVEVRSTWRGRVWIHAWRVLAFFGGERRAYGFVSRRVEKHMQMRVDNGPWTPLPSRLP